MNILWVRSSPRKESQSTKLAEALIEKIQIHHKKSMVTIEDLSKSPPAHLTEFQIGSFFTPEEELSELQKDCLKLSDHYIQQLVNSDFIIISFPVWNFSIPSSLKAWIDQIVRAGKTFKYIDSRPKGLIENKKVFLVSARGGIYPENLVEAMNGPYDYSSLLMKTVLTYIGLLDMTELKVDGLAIPGIKEFAIEKALEDLEKLNL